MNDRIAQSLTKLFEKHRIVFWYNAKQELRNEFEAIALDGIEKIELNNNEFGVKYRILRQQPKAKFLLYHEGPQPADLDNWLLDIQLAHTEFRADQVAMWLAELELGREFTDVVQSHIAFFQALERREALKRLMTSYDTPSQLRLKMLAVCAGCGSEARLEAVLEQLLGELSHRSEDLERLGALCGEELDSSFGKKLPKLELYWRTNRHETSYAGTIFIALAL